MVEPCGRSSTGTWEVWGDTLVQPLPFGLWQEMTSTAGRHREAHNAKRWKKAMLQKALNPEKGCDFEEDWQWVSSDDPRAVPGADLRISWRRSYLLKGTCHAAARSCEEYFLWRRASSRNSMETAKTGCTPHLWFPPRPSPKLGRGGGVGWGDEVVKPDLRRRQGGGKMYLRTSCFSYCPTLI